jgi:hypothetical protein
MAHAYPEDNTSEESNTLPMEKNETKTLRIRSLDEIMPDLLRELDKMKATPECEECAVAVQDIMNLEFTI